MQIGVFPSPVLARVVRIMALPGSWNSDHVCIKFEVNGCISQQTPIQGECAVRSQELVTFIESNNLIIRCYY